MIEIKNFEQFSSEKIVKESDLVRIIGDLKSKGKNIGLCVGNFDLLHPGHMVHLRAAKNFCDILVVGVTEDKFLLNKKGKGRPVYNEILRMYSLSQSINVDFVFLSKYPTAVEPLSKIKPHIYIKGIDYSADTREEINKERETIESLGGRILYPETEKLSTTEILRYIKFET